MIRYVSNSNLPSFISERSKSLNAVRADLTPGRGPGENTFSMLCRVLDGKTLNVKNMSTDKYIFFLGGFLMSFQ